MSRGTARTTGVEGERNGIKYGGDLVVVAWYDARFYGETRSIARMAEVRMAVYETVGHLISQDETSTIVAAERNDEGDCRDVTLIPTGCIKEIRRLSLVPGKRGILFRAPKHPAPSADVDARMQGGVEC